MTAAGQIAVLGATSGPGASLFLRLAASGRDVIGIGRNTTQMETLTKSTNMDLRWHACDISDVSSLKRTLAKASIVINCSNPAFVTEILQVADGQIQRLISLGSTRLYTKFPDERAAYVKKAQEDALNSGIPSTILHPTLIYGFAGNNNTRRIVELVRWFHFIPLPKGGKSLIQPIHSDDVVSCIESCLDRPETIGRAFIIAGPEPLTYAEFVKEAARADGLNAYVLSVPIGLAFFLGTLTRLVPMIPNISEMEIQRLLEDKDFEISEMREVLGVTPRQLIDGLRE